MVSISIIEKRNINCGLNITVGNNCLFKKCKKKNVKMSIRFNTLSDVMCFITFPPN